MTDLLRRAYLLAQAAHSGQVDKANVAYIEHPKRVASFVKTDEEKATAFLHDTLEDTEVIMADLQAIGMPSSVMTAVQLLTHDKNQPYFDYLAEVKQDQLARTVKLADLKHNSDVSRLHNLTDSDNERLAKYKKAIAFLQNE
ncbi:MAG: GTP pyrophosphokinase [Streptococcaceae bacterium]|nr:GTP pyrophosphokinase [Streptococcaceae bacterium]